MLRIVVRYKDDSVIKKVKKYGNVVYQSRLLNVIGVETNESGIAKIKKIPGVISVEKSAKGKLLSMAKACT